MELTNKNINTFKRKGNDMSSLVYGKISPQAPELEAAVLGAIMLEPDALAEVQGILTPEDFYSDANQRICNTIYEMSESGSRIDFMTVCEQMRKTSELELVGGTYYVTNLTRDVVSSANIIHHSRTVKEKSILRSLIRMGGELVASGYEDSQDCFDLMDVAENLLSEIRKGLAAEKIKSIGQVSIDAYEEMKEKAELKADIPGIPTGFKELDIKMGGLSSPDLTIIGAGTGEGKTSFAINIAGHVSQTDAVAFYSLEMKAKQLAWKFFAEILDKSIKQIRIGNLTPAEWEVLEKGIALIQKKKFYIKDNGGLSIIEFKNSVRSMVRKKDVKLVVLDYLQLLTTVGVKEKFGTREGEINYISKQLKALAMELDIPIIALSQLNRERAGTKRLYQLSDLRESGAIEQDADNVLFIFNPVKHKMREIKLSGTIKVFAPNEVLLQVEKCRLGGTGIIPMKFLGVRQKFEDFSSPEIEAPGNNFRPLSEVEQKVSAALDQPEEDENDLPF